MQQINHRNLNHGVASRLLTHGSTGTAYHYLSGQSRIVDAHIELEQLIMSRTTHPLAHKVHTMRHIIKCLHIVHHHHMRFIMRKIVVRLQQCLYLCRVNTFL